MLMRTFLMICFLMLPVLVFAQGEASWEPADPGFGETLTITYEPAPGTFTDNVKLHWGINESAHGVWTQPWEAIWPEGSTPWSDGLAVQSPMIKTGDGNWTLTIVTVTGTDTIRTLHFVITDGSSWDNNNSANWDIYFGGLGPPPKVHSHKVYLDILVDLSNAIRNRGFTYGDTVEFRCGYFDTAKETYIIPLARQGISSYYAGGDTVVTTLQDTLDYSYYTLKNGVPNWEVFFNFDYPDPRNSEAQRRRIKLRKWTQVVVDTAKSTSDAHRTPFFRNLNVLAQDVKVTLECDVRPAYYHLKLGGPPLEDIQPGGAGNGLTITDPNDVIALGVAVNGPITGSWSNDEGPDWGAHLMTLENKVMYDDGTHGDRVAGDSIFTTQYQFYKDSADVVGQEFKFGIGGGDNESGFGNNHVANIDDFESEATIEAQFGSIYPVFYSEWDYDMRVVTSVEFGNGSPSAYILNQNYPNPFNPSTAIRFTLASREHVILTVYNNRGEKMVTLVNEILPAGEHTVRWNGNTDGRVLDSGLYLCRFEAGEYTKTMKMVFIK
jgi:hypothetical protein